MVLAFIVITVLPLIILHFGLMGTFESHLIRQRMIEVNQRCHVIAAELGKTERVADSLTSSNISVLNWYSEAYGGRFLIIDDNYRIVLDTFDVDVGKECVTQAVFNAFEETEYQNYDRTEQFLEYVIPVKYSNEEDKHISGVLVLSSTTGWIRDSFTDTRRVILLIELIILGIILFFAFFFSSLLIQPLNRFREQLSDFGAGHRDTGPAAEGIYSELSSIADALKLIIQRYQDLDKAQEEFDNKYGMFGEKLRTEAEKAEEKKKGTHRIYMLGDVPEYKEISELYFNESRVLGDYRDDCKNKALELFSKWFWDLWD